MWLKSALKEAKQCHTSPLRIAGAAPSLGARLTTLQFSDTKRRFHALFLITAESAIFSASEMTKNATKMEEKA